MKNYAMRFISGNLRTPQTYGFFDATVGAYIPGQTFPPYNTRNPLFHQLDIRIDKKWQWRYLSLTTYLDVQNVYYHKAVEDYAYSYDYAQRAAVEGLPIIPSLGLKVEY